MVCWKRNVGGIAGGVIKDNVWLVWETICPIVDSGPIVVGWGDICVWRWSVVQRRVYCILYSRSNSIRCCIAEKYRLYKINGGI